MGLAFGVIVLIPFAIYAAVDQAVDEASRHVRAGRASTMSIVMQDVKIDAGPRFALVLDDALGLPAGTMEPLPLVAPERPHLGYGPPSGLNWAFACRIDGGPLLARQPVPLSAPQITAIGAMGGFEIYVGPQWGRLSVGGFGILGAGAVGLETRYAVPLGSWGSLVPFAGYGFYWLIGGIGFAAGHGPRAGAELNFAVGNLELFGYSHPYLYMGLVAQAGPVFLFPGSEVSVGAEFHVGLNVAIY
jgi:hypothetical protein